MEKDQTPFSEARMLAAQALDMAQRYRVPPFPRAFEVWFTYVAGGHEPLRSRIDEALASSETLHPGFIDQLHAEYLAPDKLNAGVERIGNRMGAELAEVVELIEGGTAHGETLAYKIEQADRALDAAPDPADKRKVLATLRKETKQHVRAITRLGGGLETMRTQFLAMQRELRELRQSVLFDQLTQLPNERFLRDALPRLGDEADETRQPLTLVLVDVDHFRALNKKWGEKAGDHALTSCAALLRNLLRDGDVAVRFKADVFALIARGRTVEEGQMIAEQLRTGVANLRMVNTSTGEQLTQLSASTAVALRRRGERPDMLLARAHDELSRAKANRVPVSPAA
ncbi:MAG: GGDEF domain-containing protein [Pseudomonadota bacterium]